MSNMRCNIQCTPENNPIVWSREIMGLSQSELAKKMAVSRTCVSMVEKGSAGVSVNFIELFSSVIGLPGYLVYGAITGHITKDQFLNCFRSLENDPDVQNEAA